MTRFFQILSEAMSKREVLPDGTIRIETDISIEYRNREDYIFHRLGGPAIVNKKTGYEAYWVNGKRHRLDGPAVIDRENGVEEYWVNNKRHRLNGPAYVSNDGTVESWFLNDKRHRIGGPAMVNKLIGREEYWVNGKQLTKEEYYKHFGND